MDFFLLDDDVEVEFVLSSDEDSGEDCDVAASLFYEREKRKCIKNFLQVVESYDEKTFISHFRIGRSLFNELIQKFNSSTILQDLMKQDNSRFCISAEKHILIFLWFAGHQTASYRDVSDRFDVCISSLHEVLNRVSTFLSKMAPNIIKYPNEVQKEETSHFYFNRKRFPHVIGSIDGTHIQIDKPTDRAVDYVNRKDFYSIQMQGICDENLNFIDVFIGYPGSVHDARIFRNSSVSENLATLCTNDYIILGDSAYPLSKYLITPYRDNGHLNRNQKKFNQTLSSVRVSIEHAFGLLKQRFRQLFHLKLRGHTRLCTFIHACVVLHNLVNKNDAEIFNLEEPPEDIQPEANFQEIEQRENIETREKIFREIFDY